MISERIAKIEAQNENISKKVDDLSGDVKDAFGQLRKFLEQSAASQVALTKIDTLLDAVHDRQKRCEKQLDDMNAEINQVKVDFRSELKTVDARINKISLVMCAIGSAAGIGGSQLLRIFFG